MSNNYSSFESSPTAYSYSSSTLPSRSSINSSSSPSPPSSSSPSSAAAAADSSFDCNICLDVPSEPILTPCGHLFCWSCYHNWYSLGHNDCPSCKAFISIEKIIPIYGKGKNKADHEFVKHRGGGGINKNSSHNYSSTAAPSSSAPPRPHARRTDPPPSSSDRANNGSDAFGGFFSPFGFGMGGGGGGGGLTFGAGFGFFPALFGLTFTWNSNDGWQRGGGNNNNNNNNNNNYHNNTHHNNTGVNENDDANAKLSRALIFFVLIFIFSLLFY